MFRVAKRFPHKNSIAKHHVLLVLGRTFGFKDMEFNHFLKLIPAPIYNFSMWKVQREDLFSMENWTNFPFKNRSSRCTLDIEKLTIGARISFKKWLNSMSLKPNVRPKTSNTWCFPMEFLRGKRFATRNTPPSVVEFEGALRPRNTREHGTWASN